jgi:DNA modification methylase
MNPAKKRFAQTLLIGGSFSIGIGLLLFICLMLVPPEKGQKPMSKAENIAVNLIITSPFLLLGVSGAITAGWLRRGLKQQAEEEMSDRLRSSFFRLVQEGNGNITVMRFAMDTKLSGEAAKQYLDEKAAEFNANFNVSDNGGVAYYFPELGGGFAKS